MAVAYRSSASTTYASRTNTTVAAPAGLADNDILVGCIFVGANTTAPAVTPPAGFTLLGTATSVTASGFNGKLSIFWKRASSESGSYTFTHSSASTQCLLIAVSGAITSGSPIDASSSNTGTGATTTFTGVTTTVADTLLLALAHDWEGTGAVSTPSGFTRVLDGLVMGAYASQAAAGASGDKTYTSANFGTLPWGAWLVAIKPSVGGTAYTLTAAQGTFSLAGQAANLKRGLKVPASAGSFAFSGKAANLKRGLKLPAAAGSFALSGVAAGFKRTYAASASVGTFALSGQNANLSLGHKITASAGAFSLTGVAANLVYAPVGASYTLTAVTGAFTLSGQSSDLKVSRVVGGDQGAFALTGQAAGLSIGRKVAASQGQFNLTGFDAGLTYDPAGYTLSAEVGAFFVTGLPAGLATRRVPPSINGGGGGGGYGGSFEHHYKREKEKRLDRERLRAAIDRAFARVERNEDLTSDQVEEAEEAIEKVEAAVEIIPAPDLSLLAEMLDKIGKKISSIEQDRAIERLQNFEAEMADEDEAVEALMLVA